MDVFREVNRTGLNSESVLGKQIEWRESATVDCSLNEESGL